MLFLCVQEGTEVSTTGCVPAESFMEISLTKTRKALYISDLNFFFKIKNGCRKCVSFFKMIAQISHF